MVLIKIKTIIPDMCPLCGKKLNHVNALDTEYKTYMVYCKNSRCRYCKEWRLEEL